MIVLILIYPFIMVVRMSEKRFRAMSNDVKQLYCIESVDGEMFSMQEIVDLLNEQQEQLDLYKEAILMMMSENQFYLGNNDTTICDRSQGGSDGFNMLTIFKVVDLLNEQQNTIQSLQDLCGKSDYENAKLRIENKKLKEENGQLKDDVYDALDKALKTLEEIYDDYPKNSVHRLYNNLKGLKEMI